MMLVNMLRILLFYSFEILLSIFCSWIHQAVTGHFHSEMPMFLMCIFKSALDAMKAIDFVDFQNISWCMQKKEL